MGGDQQVATSVVGRSAELAAVRRALVDTASGAATVVLADSLGFQVLSGACLSVESGVPFAPVVEALRPVLSSDATQLGASGGSLRGLLGGVSGEPAIPPGQLLELLLAALGHLATTAPVL